MELLEYLRIQTDCIYISDLRGSKRYHSICNALYRIDAQQYSLQEWNDALSYITSISVSFSNQDEVIEYLSRKTSNELFQK